MMVCIEPFKVCGDPEYPLSYFFQPGALREKVSLGEYIQHYSDVMADNTLKSTVVGTFIISLLVGGALGLFISRAANKKK
jgi:hypothetical protein